MTRALEAKPKRKVRGAPLFLFALLLFSLFFSGDVMRGVQSALALSARVIIPSLFPFMVLSELLGDALSEAGGKRGNRGLLDRLFGVSRVGMSAFLLGALCGFPLGIKHARALYDSGAIDERECARLVCFANNTGPAFVIAGVGGGLFASFRVGILLYLFQIAAALVVAIIFARIPVRCAGMTRRRKEAGCGGLVAAVRKSTASVLAVCGMVVFFSAVCALVGVFVKNGNLLLFIYPFLEVGGACSLAAGVRFSAPLLALFAAMLAICFGGMSVHMQALLFFEDGGFPLLRYLSAKLAQAAIGCGLLCLCFPFLQ